MKGKKFSSEHKQNLTNVAILASLVKKTGETPSNAMQIAWASVKINNGVKTVDTNILNSAMIAGYVRLTFKKLDTYKKGKVVKYGAVTTRIVTKNFMTMPNEAIPQGLRTTPQDVLAFYSLTDGGWRSAKKSHILKYEVLSEAQVFEMAKKAVV